MNGPWYKSSLIKKSDTLFEGIIYDENSVPLGNQEYNVNFGDSDLTWVTTAVYNCGSIRYYYDWIFVRRYVSIEPTINKIHEISVAPDIKPESCPNPLNIKSQGVFPAAILGTEDFDGTQVDPASVRLVGLAPAPSAIEDVATPFKPFTGKENVLDCNGDGPDGHIDLTWSSTLRKFSKQLSLL